MKTRTILISLAAAATITGAQAQPAARMAVVSPPPQSAAIQPQAVPVAQPSQVLEAVGTGDMLRITVFRNPELTTDARVTEQGTIAFPMIGDVPVTGLTPQQVGNRIADKLRAGRFVVNPEVTVAMAQVNSRQVSVLGNVTKPGRYPIDNVNSRLLDFVAAAGGVTGTGSDSVTVVQVREGKTLKTDVNLDNMFRQGDSIATNMELQPGDTIFVHRAPVVYVYGEVQKAGAYRLEPHMTVMQAIAMGGGLTVRGTERGVRIHRRDGNGNVKKMEVALTDQVKPDDVVFVRESLF